MKALEAILLCGALFAITNGDSHVRSENDGMTCREDRDHDDGHHDDDGDERPGPPQQRPRVYTFAMARIDPPFTYVDEEHMKVVGMSIDLIHAACRTAGQMCEIIFLKNRKLCWNPDDGYSPGLMQHQFHACVNAMPDFEKMAVNAFTRSFARPPMTALYRRENDDLRMEDIMRPNQISIGFVDMSMINQNCLTHNGAMINVGISMSYPSHEALMEALAAGQVRLAFTHMMEGEGMGSNNLVQLEANEPLRCAVAGPAVMMRKDQHDLMEWLQPALDQVMRSEAYERMCYIWARISGKATNCIMGDDNMDCPGGMNQMPRGDS